MPLSTNEIIAELELARGKAEDPDGFHTTPEYAEMLGLGDGAVRKRLKKLERDGRLERGRKLVECLSGHRQTVTAYRIVPE
jgi:DNA-binding Lrp family transcriptional regulator